MDTNQQGQLSHLSIDEIHVKPGFNPRKFFEDPKYQELVESVATHGVVQPIVVRPTHNERGGYWVVAGERRYRAAQKAQLHQVPALIRDISEQEAKLIAAIENTQRDDMSPAEEAEAARDVLMGCNNDRQEAIRLLGWSQSKFDSRLLLLHADKSVLDALTERKIKLGHAELLSQLPNDFQIATLEKILEHGYSVADLKDRLATFALDLSKACFNTSACNNCPHNSSLQASLFDDHITEGKCANRACFEQKTEQAMLDKKAALSEQYAVIYLDTERRPDSFKIVCQSGSEAVGKSQFEQGCRQCAHFGALLNTSPSQLGKVTEDCCFNLECHAEKVAAYKALIKEQPMSAKPAVNSGSNTKSVPTQPAASANKSGKSTPENKANAAAIPNRVTEKIETFYRELAAKTVTKDRRSVLCLNTFTLYQMVKIGFPKELWPDSLQKKSLTALDLEGFLKLLADVSTEDIAAFNNRMVGHLLSDHEKSSPLTTKTWAKGAVAAIKLIDVNLQEHFLLSKEFLGSFTKSGIESVLREAVNGAGVAFVEYYEKLDEKNKFPVLMKKKNNEILDEVFGCGYDFSGFVPACVIKVMGETKKAGRVEPILPKVEVPPATITESEPVAEPLDQSLKETDGQPSEKTDSEQIDKAVDEDDGILEQILTKTDSARDYADFDDFDADQEGYGAGSFDYTQDPEEYDNETEEPYV
jgi:ParB family chromosome partitioning protein